MCIVNKQFFSEFRQCSIGGVEKIVCTDIVQWSDPFSFQDSPKSFCNIQMWGIWRQIEQEKSSFCPDKSQLPYFMVAMDGCIVKYNKRVLMHTKRECIEKTDNLVCGDILRSGKTFIVIIAVNHSENIEPCDSLGRDTHIFSGQLPAVGDVSLGTDVALICIVEGDTPFTFLLFKFLQLFILIRVELRRGDSPWAFPYTLISCANADKKRLNVRLLAVFPEASCQAALALLTLCLSCSMAARTASSSEQSIIGFRPRPGRVCKPAIPSETKRFTHAFTETKLISVCSPAFAEDRPSTLRRTARQRIRKQWLAPLRKPFSSCTRWDSVNSSFFIFPIANLIYDNRMQRKTKYFI
jgi:hypothetical protein